MSRMKNLLEEVLSVAETDEPRAVQMLSEKLGYSTDDAQVVIHSWLGLMKERR